MKLKVIPTNASRVFFPNTSLGSVYRESVSNAIDAHATRIEIDIELNRLSDLNSFLLTIHDNGDGFTDSNYKKFEHLLDASDEEHKGLGRLVYLAYFNRIEIESCYDNKRRHFFFGVNEEDGCTVESLNNQSNHYSKLRFTNYNKTKIYDYKYVVPKDIKDDLITCFFPLFYQMKQDGKELIITIKLTTQEENREKGFCDSEEIIDIRLIPELEEKEIEVPGYLLADTRILYYIRENNGCQSTIISAICSDGRTINCETVSKKNLPNGYDVCFLLKSSFLDGKTNPSRETFNNDDAFLKPFEDAFSKGVSEIIQERIPSIASRNEEEKKILQNKYPHLIGYFEDENIGIIDKTKTIRMAQERFLKDQKYVLEADELDENQFEKSLELASRVLTEYILYRTRIIERMKAISSADLEGKFHDIIAPRKSKFFSNNETDYYRNNIWIIDDKFMSFAKILSDCEIDDLFSEIHVKGSLPYNQEEGKESGRPDLSIVFSSSPECEEKIDVVIVELKRLGVDLANKEELISQLKQRARRLMEFHPNKIQRIWFYGVVDYDDEFSASLLESGYIQLFSSGEVFYKTEMVMINPQTKEMRSIDVYIMNYETMINDAEKRNSTFLNVLKDSMKSSLSD